MVQRFERHAEAAGRLCRRQVAIGVQVVQLEGKGRLVGENARGVVVQTQAALGGLRHKAAVPVRDQPMQGGDGIVFVGNGNDFRALQKGARLPCIRATGEQRRHHLVRGDGAACRCGLFFRRTARALYIPCLCGFFFGSPFRALYIPCRCGFFFGSPFPFAHIPRRAHAGAVRKIQPRRA